ncbi:hypothetical protein CMT52_11260 [Elizabethkingia anophelis]|nr:hypothetical protein [Elizabethkingia anophelis]
MKKTILFFALVVSTFLFSQIKVDNSPNPIQIGKITAGSITLDKTGDKYTFCYNDAKFTKIDSFKCFSFIETGSDLDNLYNIIMGGFETAPKENIKLDLPNDKVELHFEKMMGVVSMRFSQLNKETGVYGYSGYMSKKQVNKLFGKK